MGITRRVRADKEGTRRRVMDILGGPLEVYSGLVEFLTRIEWDPGEVRVPGTMMVFVEDGRWKIWLHDRDAGEGCFVSGETLHEALEAADKAIAGGGGDWRPDKKMGRGRA